MSVNADGNWQDFEDGLSAFLQDRGSIDALRSKVLAFDFMVRFAQRYLNTLLKERDDYRKALEALQRYVDHAGHECAAYGVAARKECYGCSDNFIDYERARAALNQEEAGR